MPPSTRQVTILFADITDSTRLYDTLGGVKAQAMITACLSLLKKLVDDNAGTVVKTIGDAVLCIFQTPNQAAQTASRMHEAVSFDMTMMNANIHLRIGLHHGEVLFGPEDVHGDAVNVAARMVELAKADQIITNKGTLAMMTKALRHKARIVDRTRVRGKDDILEIHELIWGRPEQMTMNGSLTDPVIDSLTRTQTFLQIRYRHHRAMVDNTRPILTLGRGMANHLIIDDPLVSRMHARIELRRSRFMLIDQSTNGTFFKPRYKAPIILHRDETQLEEAGIIGLGQRVDDDHPLALRYRIL